jgi:type I restriction enzyme S subunit
MERDLLAGDVPPHWEFTTLGEVCRRGGGSIQTGPFGSQLHASDYVPVGIPSIMPTNIGDNRIIEEGIVRVAEADAARLSQHRLLIGDIVYSRRGDVEKRALIRQRETGWLCGTGCLKVRLGHGSVVPAYASYFLGHPAIRKWIARHAIGATMPNLNTGIMSAVPFALPPLTEQRAIAHILGALDDKIELNRKMNATLETMARALFKSWFVDFDPVRAKAEGQAPSGMDAQTAKLFPNACEDSELGPIPKGWRATTLGAEVQRCGGAVQTGPFGSQLHASDYVPEGVPVVMPKDIGGRRVSTATIARIREIDAVRLSRHRLQEGDVVYSRRGDVERHALIGAREGGWLCGTGCLLVRLGRNWPSPVFASFALDRPETRAWISQHAIGATMPNLNTGILSAVPLVMPPDDVLGVFARAVDPLQALIVVRDAEAGLLANVRDGLLPRLLSGELSVTQAERTIEATA